MSTTVNQTVTVTVDAKGNMSFNPSPDFTSTAPETLIITYNLASDTTSQAHRFTTAGMDPSARPSAGGTTFSSALQNNDKTLVVTNQNSLTKGATAVVWSYNVCVTNGTTHFKRVDPTISDEGPK